MQEADFLEHSLLSTEVTRRSLLKGFLAAPAALDVAFAREVPGTSYSASTRQETGIFQTGLDTIAIDNELYKVELRPPVMRSLILHLAKSRGDSTLVERVTRYLDTYPLEIHLSSRDHFSEKVIASDGDVFSKTVVDGNFTKPETISDVYLPTRIGLSKHALTRLYWAELAVRRPDLIESEEKLWQSLNVRVLAALPHEVEHFINYVDNPDSLTTMYQGFTRKKILVNILSILVGSSLGTIVISKQSGPLSSSREALVMKGFFLVQELERYLYFL